MEKNKVILWIGGIAATLGLIFIAVKNSNRKQDEKKVRTDGGETLPAPVEPETPQAPPVNLLDAATQGIVKAVRNIVGKFMKYRVNTKETALNVRQKPDGSSRIVSKLPKDSKIFARSANVIGWMEVSKDGKKPIGFVSSAFLVYEVQ